jgi:ketosteroid isomerase-like protein
MSSENVEIVRKATDAYRRGALEEGAAWMDPEIVWDMSRLQVPDAGVYRGFDGLLTFFNLWQESWESLELEPLEFIEAGDQVVTVIRQSGRGKLSGAEVEHRFAQLWTLRDRRIVRMDMYPDRQAALEAADTTERVRR